MRHAIDSQWTMAAMMSHAEHVDYDDRLVYLNSWMPMLCIDRRPNHQTVTMSMSVKLAMRLSMINGYYWSR